MANQLGHGLSLGKTRLLSSYLLDLNFLNSFPSEVTHSRASGATYVASDGLVKWAPENLNPGPASSWGKTGLLTVTGDNTAGYLLTADTNGGVFHMISTSTTATNPGGWERIEFDVKQAGGSANVWCGTRATSSGVLFNLTTGTVQSGTSADQPASITALGDGWFRCVVRYNRPTASILYPTILITKPPSSTLYAGTGEALLVKRIKVARGYDTDEFALDAESPIYGPRITHDPVTLEPLGYLYDPASTNSFLRSSDYSASWLVENLTRTANAAVAPNGQTVATKFVDTAASTYHRLRQTVVTTATPWTVSGFVKIGPESSITRVRLSMYRSTGATTSAWFDLENIAVLSVNSASGTARIEDYGNGWRRVSLTENSAYAGNNVVILAMSATDGDSDYLGDTTGEIYVWGMQMENRSAPTSLIHTGTATATRAADVATLAIPATSDGVAYVTYGDETTAELAAPFSSTWTLPYRSTGPTIYRRIQLQRLAASFDPYDLGVVADYDASVGLFDAAVGGSAVVDGGSVERWEDQSGNGHHLVKTLSSQPPTLDIDAGPTSDPAVIFNGVNQGMGRGSFVVDQPCTAFFALKLPTMTNSDYIFETRGGGVRPTLYERSFNDLRGRGDMPTPGPIPALNKWFIAGMADEAAEIVISVNGVETKSSTVAVTAGATSLTVGCNIWGATNGWADMQLSRMLLFDSKLSEGDRARVATWLRRRYPETP